MATREEVSSTKSLPLCKLPIDILVEEILPTLPAKSLLRFKCVSKFFQTLISTPEFIDRHLHQSLSSNTDRQLILIGNNGAIYTIHLDSPEFSPVSLPFPGNIKMVHSERLFIVGSCNGLVCMETFPYCLVVFNPSTGIFKKIYCNNLPLGDSYTNYGFGFDDMNDDYKIVRVMSQVSNIFDDDDANFTHETDRKVEVYSLKSDSWSLVDRTICIQEFVKTKENGALIDGHLVHWKFWYLSAGDFEIGSAHGKYRIGCFDLRNDRWGDDVPLPEHWLENCTKLARLVHLGVLDGCLCLLIENLDGKGDDVWVMKEYGVKDSWVKLVYIGFQDVRPQLEFPPFTYAKGSRTEILVRIDSRSKFLWCNTRDNIWRWAELHGMPTYSKACISKGSLISIPGSVRFQIGASSGGGYEKDASTMTI